MRVDFLRHRTMYFFVTVLLVVRMIVHRNIVDIHCDTVLPKLLKHGLSVVILHLYDIEMPSAVRLRQLIRSPEVRMMRTSGAPVYF